MDNVEPLFSENSTNMCFWQCWTPNQLQQDCIIQGGRTCFSRTVKFSVDWCIHSNTNCFLKVSQGHSQCLDVPSGSPDGCCSVSFERDWNFTQLVPPHFMSVWWCRSTSTSYMAANVTLKYIIVVKTISCHWQYGLTPQWLDTPGLRIYLMDNLEMLLSNEINCLWVPFPTQVTHCIVFKCSAGAWVWGPIPILNSMCYFNFTVLVTIHSKLTVDSKEVPNRHFLAYFMVVVLAMQHCALATCVMFLCPPPQLGLHSSFASIAESQIHMAFLASAQLQQCNGVTFGDVLLLTFYFMGCIAGDNSMNAPMLRGIPICKK